VQQVMNMLIINSSVAVCHLSHYNFLTWFK